MIRGEAMSPHSVSFGVMINTQAIIVEDFIKVSQTFFFAKWNLDWTLRCEECEGSFLKSSKKIIFSQVNQCHSQSINAAVLCCQCIDPVDSTLSAIDFETRSR